MADPKYSFAAPSGTLMFPRLTRVMDIKSSPDPTDFPDPLNATMAAIGSQMSSLPDVSAVSARAKLPSAAALPDSAELEETEGAIKRPNGELYIPRTIKAGDTELQDVAVIRLAYAQGIPVLLTGDPGTGKTALIEAALENVITLAGDGDTTADDFVGGYVQNPDGTYSWVDGPMLVAMEGGRPFFVDEVALVPPLALAVMYSAMDGRGEVYVKQNPARGTVKAQPGFYVAGACNPDVPGAVMSEALTSRFLMQIDVKTDYDLAQTSLGVPREIVVVAKTLKRKKDNNDILGAPQMRELLGFKRIAENFGVNAALANFISKAEPGDRDAYAEAIKSTFGKDISSLAIG